MAGRPRSFDEGEVLDRAMALFWEKGYAGTGLSELEAATGLGRQSLYGAFGDKRALFERVVEHYVERVLRPGMLEVLEAPGSPRGNLERMIESWELLVAAPGFNGCLIGNCIAELSARDPEVTDVLAPKLELMETWLRRTLARAQRAGELAAELDIKAVARTLLAMSQGLGVVARVNRDRHFVRAVAQSAKRLLGAG
jgi:TetR/AcrR family transcriptional regulator, transcriptional repressor for nem operon